MEVLVLVLVLAIGGVLTLGVLTGMGARRRGQNAVLAVVAGLFFPLTWTVWYVRDEGTSAHRHR